MPAGWVTQAGPEPLGLFLCPARASIIPSHSHPTPSRPGLFAWSLCRARCCSSSCLSFPFFQLCHPSLPRDGLMGHCSPAACCCSSGVTFPVPAVAVGAVTLPGPGTGDLQQGSLGPAGTALCDLPWESTAATIDIGAAGSSGAVTLGHSPGEIHLYL